MDKLSVLNRIKELYLNNENIIEYLKTLDKRNSNTTEDILISYDLQAGTYTAGYKNNMSDKDRYSHHLASIINEVGNYKSILEAGIGEATTFGPALLSLDIKPEKCYGFDISWSRIKYAKRFLRESNFDYDVELFTGDLFNAPIKDNSIDIVYTSHTIEPNGGREREALQELYRITNKYLILLEPGYEFANEEAKKRMLAHGYVTKLYSTVKELGYDVIEHRPFEESSNPLNPTGLMIIRKNKGNSDILSPLCCPITKTDILKKSNAYFSQESLLAYPVIDEIPCLLPQNAIVATKFLD